MAQKKNLQAKGLYTDPNLLSEVPEGALVEADNVIIDRNAVIEPRRGFSAFGTTFGLGTDRAKQVIEYKERILIHYANKLIYNNNDHTSANDGNFLEFDGTFSETENGLRIKYEESNRNLYFTTNDGIKKISAETASDFTTDPGFIIDAGGVKALDVVGQLNTETTGFIPANSKVAYRVVWGYNDNNNNLIIGSPSSRLVITNFNDVSANVDLQFVIPQAVNSNYFYQVYRTGIFTATGNLGLDDIDPGDEMNLVIEDFPTSAQLSAGTVEVSDITPEDFRRSGTPLYTNPNSGEGIIQANEPPPKAKDLALYQNTTFYANTETRARKELSLLGVANLTSGSSTITIDDGINPAQTYTFVGEKEVFDVDFAGYTGTIPTDLDGKYWLANSSSNIRKYYVWYDNTKTTQILNFANYVGAVPQDLDGLYAVFYTPTRSYYIWFDSTGSVVDPGTIPTNTDLTGRVGIKVDTSGDVSLSDVCASIDAALTTQQPVFNDYDNLYTASDEFVTIESESFDDLSVSTIETIQQGFEYTINTPTTNDPSLTPGVNTDVVGRIGIKVNVSRNVSTNVGLADATAAAILDQDAANDFTVSYTGGTDILKVTNNNNGNTDDAVDSVINGVGNGISIVTIQQGDGEDSALNNVLLSDAATPSQQIDETARSLVNIINKNSNDVVYAFYLSGPNDIPGKILLEVRDIGTSEFTVVANDANTGSSFNPSLPPAVGASEFKGESESLANRLYFSKIQQPEAVPIVNFIDVGPQDRGISRVLSLRESLFILKEDGIYRLTGLNGAFTVDLFDESTKIIAPDSAVVLNNQIYCLTNQGVAVISDTGVNIISKQLDNVFQIITSSNYNFRLTSFGVSYETDRSYILWLPSNTIDDVATQAYRYNTFTQSWTRYPISKTCGLVNSGDDKLYLGASDQNFIERERKNFNRTDYSDREFDINIPSESVDRVTVDLSVSNLAEIGDALVQTQYLTINQFNKLLKKLDLDPGADNDYLSTTEANPGDNLRNSLDAVAIKMDSDSKLVDTDYFASLGGGTSFVDIQSDFNIIIDKVNSDDGAIYDNYLRSEGIVELESLILGAKFNSPEVTLEYSLKLIEGPVRLYKGISTTVTYAPETFGDPSVMKQVREGTIMFENNNFSRAELGYKSDLSPGVEEVAFNRSGKGDWGSFIFDAQNWGGGFSGVPLRTYIPRSKQRCRYIQARFQHDSAREKFAIFGISYTLRGISERAYRD